MVVTVPVSVLDSSFTFRGTEDSNSRGGVVGSIGASWLTLCGFLSIHLALRSTGPSGMTISAILLAFGFAQIERLFSFLLCLFS